MTTTAVAILMGATSPRAVLIGDGIVFLGDDFLPWIVLAIGAAMIVGNALALVRPPTPVAGDHDSDAGEPQRPPLRRALVMIAIGAVAAIWGIASLVA